MPWIPPAVMISSPIATESCIAWCWRWRRRDGSTRKNQAKMKRTTTRIRVGIEALQGVAFEGAERALLDRLARAAGELEEEA